jgi:tetratricopeptide (TPR) repeat protein
MCIRILPLFVGFTLFAADGQQLTPGLRAQADFDRVELAARPQLQETNSCIQSQVAAIAVAQRAELSSLYFRKGYCTLAGATLTHNSSDFADAAAAFDKSIAAWPDAISRNPSSDLPQPVSSGLRVLAAVSKLEADPAAAVTREIEAAIESPVCPSSVMSPTLCQSLAAVGREWLGWTALQQDDLYGAQQQFSTAAQSAWARWTAGVRAFRDRNYQQASTRYREAVNIWTRAAPASVVERLEPQPDLPRARMQLGGAQILAGQPAEAIPSLDAAIKGNPGLERAIYYRALAEELSGHSDTALADYNLASRTAFANARDLVSGEAHLYRGISFYRRKDYAHAEDEFASALNFGIAHDLKQDAQAWRYMAAVAGGACGASRLSLEDALVYSSPYFPKQEARTLASSCPLSAAAAPAQHPSLP